MQKIVLWVGEVFWYCHHTYILRFSYYILVTAEDESLGLSAKLCAQSVALHHIRRNHERLVEI